MTKDEILLMAREAELFFNCPSATREPLPHYVAAIERFASLVAAKAAADENEACASICDFMQKRYIEFAKRETDLFGDRCINDAGNIAKASEVLSITIRARNKTQKEI